MVMDPNLFMKIRIHYHSTNFQVVDEVMPIHQQEVTKRARAL